MEKRGSRSNPGLTVFHALPYIVPNLNSSLYFDPVDLSGSGRSPGADVSMAQVRHGSREIVG
jgi:hypothetical protein